MGIGGRSALDFITKVDNYCFKDAVKIIQGKISAKAPKCVESHKKSQVKS